MARHSKRVRAIRSAVDRGKLYRLVEALEIAKQNASAKFDESIDVSVNLGVDARKSDQLVRGSVVLPQGTGKTVRVAVFAQADKAQEAKDAGADVVAGSVAGSTADVASVAVPVADSVADPAAQR